MNTRSRICLILSIACFFGLTNLVWAEEDPTQGDFYVSPDGNDTGPGTLAQPFATLGRAKQAVQSLVAAGLTKDLIVYTRGGTYLMDSTLVFTQNDSGTSNHSITYKAYPGEEVRLIAGDRLEPEWFVPVTDPAIIARLPVGASEHVLVADLAANGITNYGTLLYRGFEIDDQYGAMELFVGTKAMHLARWPNSNPTNPNTGWVSMASVVGGSHDRKFTYSGSQPDRWTTAPDAWVWAYSSTYYADNFVAIESIDTVNNIITLVEDPYNGIEFRSGFTPVWFGFNLLEELDAANEWYLDRSTGKLYFYPPSSLEGQDLFVSMLDTLIQCQGAKYLNFEGLIVEMTRFWSVRLDSACDHIRFYRCVFRNSGTDSVDIKGTNNGIDHCEIYDNGDGAIALHGGSRYPLVWANNYVKNSHIHNLNRWGKTYQPALFTRHDCGMTVDHNLIHNLSGIAYIYSRSNEVTITNNEIYNVCQMVDDNGALYAMWDWAARTHRVMYNFIHHVSSVMGGEGVHAVYMDTGGSGQIIKQNIFYQIAKRAVMIGGGRDSQIDNNIIAKCGSGVMIDKRLKDPTYSALGTMLGYYADFINANPDWSTYYPGLNIIPVDNPELPKNNKVIRNLGWSNTRWTENGYWGWWGVDWPNNPPINYLIQQDNITNSDPKFVDEANLNMNLQASSPAYTIPGWQDIPFNQIGLAPEAPGILLYRNGCSAQNDIVVYGSSSPWASIQTAVIQESGQDISSLLTIADNGSIYGVIPASMLTTGSVTVAVTVKDPKNHVSPAAVSATLQNLFGDMNNDCSVDLTDLNLFAGRWLNSGCSDPGWCEGADIDKNGVVNILDFAQFSKSW